LISRNLESRCFLEFGDMPLKSIFVQMLLESAVEPPMKSNAMVVDIATDSSRRLKFLESFVPVELVSVGNHDIVVT